MDGDSISPIEAKKLRVAMRAVGDREDAEKVDDILWCDEVEICGALTGDPRAPKQLVLSKDGKKTAAIMVTPRMLKRLRSEMEFWSRLHSGSAKAFRLGNQSR